MKKNDTVWTIKIDWLNILCLLRLEKIADIPEHIIDQSIRNLNKHYGSKNLLKIEPNKLDEILSNELKNELRNFLRKSPLNLGKKIKIRNKKSSDASPIPRTLRMEEFDCDNDEISED